MDTDTTRITRAQAAMLAGVSERTINRWSAAGIISVERDPYFRRPSTYDPGEVKAASKRWVQRLIDMKTLQLPE